ncbi:mediator complex subunit 25 von Willebrand factor type A-domain-containing protein [Radiomyces spectabilis]|uniref:mediator complex subunit 25 von Willebrand factor type A-domain-containing protein n=1 Tax=Radiomyces spectabilis TaxID=64574 RepID=UPI00221FE42B|nr:mediator complex subunit 25 von Willebrand factor type A-domain-containing protein [Radiomyces spectabilis]KAI8394137.1 mediator complex subunit 25 von Willebrand factor type A-domain-containing protein [Radiomyces spectabilis]
MAMAAAVSTPPVATPGSIGSPTPNYHPSPQITTHRKRREVACVFVVDGTARMKPYLDTLYEAYVEPILRQLRQPIIMGDGDERQSKANITPVLKYGLVIYGDYGPSSAVTVDRKFFTSDLSLFQKIFKSIVCADGGIVRNAVVEGLVAALEMFDQYKEEGLQANYESMMHCILISNSFPLKQAAQFNLDNKYDNFSLHRVAEEMKKENVHLSLITPRKGYKELEDLVTEVNKQKTEIHTVSDPVAATHVVKLAGFTLPPKQIPAAPAATATNVKRELEGTSGFLPTVDTSKKRPSEAHVSAASPQTTASPDTIKRRKRENVPDMISLPKPTLDPSKFAEASARVDAQFGQRQPKKEAEPPRGPAPAAATTAVKPSTLQQASAEATMRSQPPVEANKPADMRNQQNPMMLQQQAQQQAQQQQQQPSQPTAPQQQQQQAPQQQPPSQPQSQQQPAQQQQQHPPQQYQPPQQATSLQQPQQPMPPQQNQPLRIPPNVQNPIQLQQYLLQQRNNLMAQNPLNPLQQQQLQAIQIALQRLGEQIRRAELAQQNALNNTGSPMAPGVGDGSAVRPTADMSKGMAGVQHNLQTANTQSLSTLQQQRMMLAQMQPNQQSPQQAGVRLPQDMAGGINPQLMQMAQGRVMQPPQQPQQAQAPPSQQQGQPQQQIGQQPQQQQGMMIWSGQIVWHIKTPEGKPEEFSCHCGAFAITLKGSNIVGLEEYRPDMWPARIQIAGRSPLVKAQIVQRQAIENKLPFCQFRPLPTSTQQDQTNFALLMRNLDQKKYIATVVFNAGSTPDQYHGVVLTHSAGKLVGIVFTRIPLPDLNSPVMPNANMAAAGMNLNMMAANNPNVQQMLRNQYLQQQQQQQQQQMLMNAAAMGTNPNQPNAQGARPAGLNPNSLLLSNMNLGNPQQALQNNMMMGNMGQLNLANLTPQALQELQRKIMMAQRQNAQHP